MTYPNLTLHRVLETPHGALELVPFSAMPLQHARGGIPDA